MIITIKLATIAVLIEEPSMQLCLLFLGVFTEFVVIVKIATRKGFSRTIHCKVITASIFFLTTTAYLGYEPMLIQEVFFIYIFFVDVCANNWKPNALFYCLILVPPIFYL